MKQTKIKKSFKYQDSTPTALIKSQMEKLSYRNGLMYSVQFSDPNLSKDSYYSENMMKLRRKNLAKVKKSGFFDPNICSDRSEVLIHIDTLFKHCVLYKQMPPKLNPETKALFKYDIMVLSSEVASEQLIQTIFMTFNLLNYAGIAAETMVRLIKSFYEQEEQDFLFDLQKLARCKILYSKSKYKILQNFKQMKSLCKDPSYSNLSNFVKLVYKATQLPLEEMLKDSFLKRAILNLIFKGRSHLHKILLPARYSKRLTLIEKKNKHKLGLMLEEYYNELKKIDYKLNFSFDD